MGLDGVRPLGESYEVAVQAHEQCQEAARGGFSPQKKNWVEEHAGRCGVFTNKGAFPKQQSNTSFVQEPRLLDKDRGSLSWKYLLNEKNA